MTSIGDGQCRTVKYRDRWSVMVPNFLGWKGIVRYAAECYMIIQNGPSGAEWCLMVPPQPQNQPATHPLARPSQPPTLLSTHLSTRPLNPTNSNPHHPTLLPAYTFHLLQTAGHFRTCDTSNLWHFELVTLWLVTIWLVTFRTCDPSDFWPFGLLTYSDLRPFGFVILRNCGPSNYWLVSILWRADVLNQKINEQRNLIIKKRAICNITNKMTELILCGTFAFGLGLL